MTMSSSTIAAFWRRSIWPGFGLLSESFLLFSIGTLSPIWQLLFPECFDADQIECDDYIIRQLTYSVVLGIVIGMIVLGLLTGTIGRRKGSIITACLMCFGACSLAIIVCTLETYDILRYSSLSFFVFGVGVGGEYPLSAASATEQAISERSSSTEKEDFIHRLESSVSDCRGRQVQLVFSMQGVGILLHCFLFSVLLRYTGQSATVISMESTIDEESRQGLFFIWRTIYIVASLLLIGVLTGRILFLQESIVWQQDQVARSLITSKRKPQMTHESSDAVSSLEQKDTFLLSHNPTSFLWQHYGLRLLGTSLCWFLWDITFYGNKLFQSTFILALTGEGTTLSDFTFCATLNATIALAGYLGAAFLLDKIGRRTLQFVGLFLTGILFLICGLFHGGLSKGTLVVLYFLSSLTGQIGPNATTFLIPTEIFPTAVRTWCHGIAAASGKMGALASAILFSYVGETDLFLISSYAAFAAGAVTFYLVPETLYLDMREVDRKWHCILSGKPYRGIANHPDFLSFYERKYRLHLHNNDESSSDHFYVLD